MDKFKVFVDGESGTTGLQIMQRLASHPAAHVLRIDPEKRRDPETRYALINQADIVFLCLPDDAARESVTLVENPRVRVIDASTAHRVSDGWVYGLPEMDEDQRAKIRKARFVSVPGCHATCFVLAVRPLIRWGLIDPAMHVAANSITGYSGGGKPMIEKFEKKDRASYHQAARPYALGLTHKHLPEMQFYAGLDHPPLFEPIVCDFYKGMALTVMFAAAQMKRPLTPSELREMYAATYEGARFVSVNDDLAACLDDGAINPMALNDTNYADINVAGNSEQIAVITRLDNLGKGSSGAAVQCMNIMMGVDEGTGL